MLMRLVRSPEKLSDSGSFSETDHAEAFYFSLILSKIRYPKHYAVIYLNPQPSPGPKN